MNLRTSLILIAASLIVSSALTGFLVSRFIASTKRKTPTGAFLPSPGTRSAEPIRKSKESAPLNVDMQAFSAKLGAIGQFPVLGVFIKDTVEVTDQKEKIRQMWTVQGEADIVVNFGLGIVKAWGPTGNSIAVFLPRPKPSPLRFEDRDMVLVYKDEWKWFGSKTETPELAERALKEGREKLEQQARSEKLIEMARPIAESIIKNLFEGPGLSVEVMWQDMAVPVGTDSSTPQKRQAPAP